MIWSSKNILNTVYVVYKQPLLSAFPRHQFRNVDFRSDTKIILGELP